VFKNKGFLGVLATENTIVGVVLATENTIVGVVLATENTIVGQ
jgi:hypothetical protein